jgi:hypothetical protein
MKLGEVRSAYEDLSAKASDIARQLGFAGIGLIWLFTSRSLSVVSVDQRLLKAALFIFLSLGFDLAQYLLGATTWFIYFRYKERENISHDAQFEAPDQINWPTWTLFYLKLSMMVTAYCGFIIPFLVSSVTA